MLSGFPQLIVLKPILVKISSNLESSMTAQMVS